MTIEEYLEIMENNHPLVGDPRPYGDVALELLRMDIAKRILALEKEKAALAAPPGSRHPLGVLPLSADHHSTHPGRQEEHD
jgi:hypothetical protein